jgi:formiminotetrahydrofolate cyclodeaminase
MDFLDEVAAPSPTPGGGSASAYSGAMAAALLMMYTGLTLARKSYAGVHDEMQRVRAQAAGLKEKLSQAVEQDARAFEAVMETSKMEKGSSERAAATQEAMKGAAMVPMRVAEDSARALQLARSVMDKGLKSAKSDITVATFLAQAAIRGALENVRANLAEISDEQFVAEYRERIMQVEALL